MNVSEPAGDAPLGVVTITATAPDPAGASAVIDESDITLNPSAGLGPKLTRVAPLNPEPRTSTGIAEYAQTPLA